MTFISTIKRARSAASSSRSSAAVIAACRSPTTTTAGPSHLGPERRQVVIRRLRAFLALGDHRPEHAVHPLEQRRDRAEVLAELLDAVGEEPLRAIPQRDVGAAEAVDRLFRIADDEDLAWPQHRLRPRRRRQRRVVGRQRERDVELQRIGVLELVDEDHVDAFGHRDANLLVRAQHIAGVDQQIVELEPAALSPLLDAGERERLQPRHEALHHRGAQLLEQLGASLVGGRERRQDRGLVAPQSSALP